MPARPRCSHVTRAGSPCRGWATHLDPGGGPLCMRHAHLVRRRLDGAEDRSRVVAVRFSPSEWERLAQVADFHGVSLSELVRHLVLDFPLPAPPPSRAEELLHRQWASLGNLLNQAAAVLNASWLERKKQGLPEGLTAAHLKAVRACREELTACRQELIRARISSGIEDP